MNIGNIGSKIESFIKQNPQLIGLAVPVLTVGGQKNFNIGEMFNFKVFSVERGLGVINPDWAGGTSPSIALQNTFKFGAILYCLSEFLGIGGRQGKEIGKWCALGSVFMNMVDPPEGSPSSGGRSGGSSGQNPYLTY